MRLSGNFKKIRKIFSQFLVLKDRFFKDRSFFYATFLKFVFTEAPAQFLQETKRFARGLLKALRLTGDHQKCFRKLFEIFFFYFLFKVFRWERMGFLLFSVGEEWFSRLTRIPSGIFWRCKIDEILISFYPLFSVWYCLFGFLQKFASVCEARLRLCVWNISWKRLCISSIEFWWSDHIIKITFTRQFRQAWSFDSKRPKNAPKPNWNFVF